MQRFAGKQAAKNDMLDSLVLAVTASRPIENLVSIPELEEKDALGLPMEIVFSREWLPEDSDAVAAAGNSGDRLS